MTQPNMIDAVTTNDIPTVTPEKLLEENPSFADIRAVEVALGRFDSTTGFLRALEAVLLDLEANEEAEAIRQFRPILAEVESSAMNGDPTTIRVETQIVSHSERVLRLKHYNPSPNGNASNPVESEENLKARFSMVVDGQLINAGESIELGFLD